MRDDGQRIAEALAAIDLIERYAGKGRDIFDEDELVQTWMVHYLEVVGEALSRVSAAYREQHREVPWAAAVKTRNVLVHDYFRIDLDEVWGTIVTDVPVLKDTLEALLRAG